MFPRILLVNTDCLANVGRPPLLKDITQILQLKRIQELFSGSGDIPGIRNAALYPSAVDRPNRYDLMIQLDMDRQALEAWDESALHRRWKEEFSPFLQSKAIFDWEP